MNEVADPLERHARVRELDDGEQSLEVRRGVVRGTGLTDRTVDEPELNAITRRPSRQARQAGEFVERTGGCRFLFHETVSDSSTVSFNCPAVWGQNPLLIRY
jgi:hypothetical protein